MIAHCLFEQSGTFKRQFRALGIEAYDYDIQNEFGETDYQIDLYAEIEGGVQHKPSIFDEIKQDDIVIAFFPCTRFEAFVPLLSRGEAIQQQNWQTDKKLRYSMQIVSELNHNYQIISKLVLIAYERQLKLIIENPYTPPHFLTQYWPIKPAIVDKDRRDRGDKYKKPTQYYFIGVEPKNNFIWEPLPYHGTNVTIERAKAAKGIARATERSSITSEYANRFIREFIL